jgi:chloramphenicol 3-O phosphotransferase
MNSLQSARNSHILLLNGPSSAGKSTLAKEIQKCAVDPYIHVQWDSFLAMIPDESAHAKQGSRQNIVPLMRNCMHAAVLNLYGQGLNVIWDNAMHPSRWKSVAEEFADSRIFLVGVTCDVEELERRELVRGNRTVGMARTQAEEMHVNIDYDLHVDTTQTAALNNAEILMQEILRIDSPSAIKKMREKLCVNF